MQIQHIIKTISAVLCYMLMTTNAQVVFKQPELRVLTTTTADISVVPKFELTNIPSNEELKQEALQESANYIEGGLYTGEYRFGKSYNVMINAHESGKWETLRSDASLLKRWRLRITSPHAVSLNLIFNQFDIPANSEFYVIASGGDGAVHGPYTDANVKENKQFATFPILGNELTLEYIASADSPLPKLQISNIIHGFQQPLNLRDSGECNINVACKLALPWQKEKRSVAMILKGSGTGFCTGAMINNARRDGRQMFLTAFHCVGFSSVDNNILLFNYETPDCNGTSRSAPRVATAHGLKKLSQWRQSDFALLELQERIPEEYNVHLAGWSAIDTVMPDKPVGIHHPSADVKKISQSHSTATEACWGWCDDSDPLDHWEVPRWHRGTTEPGSSGSPLFESGDHRIVGQLHGGTASCDNPDGYDRYGKLSESFDQSPSKEQQLKPFLDPEGTGILVMDGADLNALRSEEFRFVIQA